MPETVAAKKYIVTLILPGESIVTKIWDALSLPN